jgi:ABC-type nitrate/sulfonate/bicarbonate transport system substrate-binding protein
MERLRFTLDFTPNANHSGVFAAIHHGWYKEAGIDLELQHRDFQHSGIAKLELGIADVAFTAMLVLGSYQKQDSFPIKAIATAMQNDLSTIAVLAKSGIERPAHLDGRSYASCQAGFKNPTVAALIRSDGGQGDLTFTYPEKISSWEALAENEADSVWIYRNWQGVQAELAGVDLRHFTLGDYGAPYCYSLVMVANTDYIARKASTLRAFLAATAKGYAWAAENPDKMAEILYDWVADADKHLTFLKAAQAATSPHYISSKTGSWGHMEVEKVYAYLKWRKEQGLETTTVEADALVTNELLG